MDASTRTAHVIRVDDGRVDAANDQVASEEPLEVRLNGHPFAVIMRTPAADHNLVAGFLFTEGVIRSGADLDRIDAAETGVVNAVLSRSRAEILPDLLDTRRNVAQNASCGMCGRRTLESLDIDARPLDVQWQVAPEVITRMPVALRAAQEAFDETGGLHAAGLFDVDGSLLLSAEDVGRHNAVDKLLGRMLLQGELPLSRTALFVSGRASFEIVQKAVVGGIPLVAAVSAPSSLAIEVADRMGVTLVGFVRGQRFNIYSHQARIK